MTNKIMGISIGVLTLLHFLTGIGEPVYYIAGGIIFLLTGKE